MIARVCFAGALLAGVMAAFSAAAMAAKTGAGTDMVGDLKQMVLVALLNPAAIATGFVIGRRADQWQKLVIGGFAAGFAGLAFVWLMDKLGLYVGDMRSVGGVFALSFLVGVIWSLVGYLSRQARRS